MPGAGLDIGVGADDQPWVIGTNRVNFRYSYKISNWQAGTGAGDNIAVDP